MSAVERILSKTSFIISCVSSWFVVSIVVDCSVSHYECNAYINYDNNNSDSDCLALLQHALTTLAVPSWTHPRSPLGSIHESSLLKISKFNLFWILTRLLIETSMGVWYHNKNHRTLQILMKLWLAIRPCKHPSFSDSLICESWFWDCSVLNLLLDPCVNAHSNFT